MAHRWAARFIMSDHYNIGKEVELKNDDKPMTVDKVKGDRVRCVWRDKEGRVCREWFDIATLQPHEQRDFFVL